MGWKRQDAMCGVGIDHKPDELDFDLSMMTTSRSRVLEDRDFVLLSLVCCVSKATYLRRMDAVRNTKKKTEEDKMEKRSIHTKTKRLYDKNWREELGVTFGATRRPAPVPAAQPHRAAKAAAHTLIVPAQMRPTVVLAALSDC